MSVSAERFSFRKQELPSSEAVHFLFEQVLNLGNFFCGAGLAVHSFLPTVLVVSIWAIST